MSVASALGAQAEKLTIEWRGRELEIGYLEWGPVITALENWLIDRALKNKTVAWELAVAKGFMKPEQAADKMMEFIEDSANGGTYSFGSPAMMAIFSAAEKGDIKNRSIGSFAGVIKLLSLLLKINEDEVITLMSEKAGELAVKMAIALKRSMPDPKDNGAAQAPEK